MERPTFKPPGTPVKELDTPALVLDLDALDHNLNTVHSFFQGRTAKLRPHVKAHHCPTIARHQLAVEGTMGGICTAKVGQAEVFVQHGFTDVLVANEVVVPSKINRLCALAREARITVAVDSAENVEDLSQGAQTQGVTLRVLVDIDCRLHRCGVEPGAPALELARRIHRAPGLDLAGIMAYEGCLLHDNPEALAAETREAMIPVLHTKELLLRDGLPVETVSVGGTHNYEILGAMEGVTEVQAGSYALMDLSYVPYRPQLKPALKVLGTVISHPEEAIAVVDVGQKAIGADIELPIVEAVPGATVSRLSAEHGILNLEGPARNSLDLGSRVWMVPHYAEVCINLYNYVNATRQGRLEAIWEVSARGRFD